MDLYVICWLLSAVVGAMIGNSKGRPAAGAIWGLLLGPFGWLIVLAGPAAAPKCPECGGDTVRGARRCKNCGTLLSEAAPGAIDFEQPRMESPRPRAEDPPPSAKLSEPRHQSPELSAQPDSGRADRFQPRDPLGAQPERILSAAAVEEDAPADAFAPLDDESARQASPGWHIPVMVLAVLLAIPLGVAIQKAAHRPAPSAEISPEMKRAHARAFVGNLCESQHDLEEFRNAALAARRQASPQLGEQCSQAIDLADAIMADMPRLKEIGRRVADGDLSPPALEAMNEAGATLLKYADQVRAKGAALQQEANRSADDETQRQRRELARKAEQAQRDHGFGLGMTQAGYDRLREGMSKFDVDLILDRSGVERASSGSYAVYDWSEGLKVISCTFDGDQLVTKAQAGL